ncbi:peptidase M3 family protein [Nitzschia inconspicua]|uniref:Peptidase M3 family protein n=1 Tax=Nitzschia inconspicua TaxID=303405 RepID=A0A9K3Q765_9STRA|nr:peptidase M3 family protein [Nitzschia inconspicua]
MSFRAVKVVGGTSSTYSATVLNGIFRRCQGSLSSARPFGEFRRRKSSLLCACGQSIFKRRLLWNDGVSNKRLSPTFPDTLWNAHNRQVGAAARCFRTVPASNNPSTHHHQTGLFSIPGLVYPSDFQRLTRQAMYDSDALRAQIPDDPDSAILTKEHAVETLYMLDKISQIVCNVIDAAELCRSAHASAEWRHAADQAFGSLQDYIVTLNTDQSLYYVLATIEAKFFSELTEEEQRFCFLLKREFELDGIHLQHEKRQEVKELHSQVTTLESLYMSNITHSSKQFAVDAELVESVIPRHVLLDHGAIYGINDDDNSTTKIQLTADTPITHSITSFAPSGDLRRHVYLECMTSCKENIECLEALRDARHRLALALGFPSYSHRFLQDKMAQSPENVSTFLQDLHRRIQPLYKHEMELILRAKQQVEGPSSQQVEPWDVKFYTKLIKSQHGLDPNHLAPYLSLSNTLEATQMLVQRLFGIEMRPMKMEDEERWDVDDGRNRTGHREETIQKFVFTEEETGRELGTMYLDLHPRPGKYTHAAHFTVRCGCLLTNNNGGVNDPPEYQKPIVALVCNMNTGHASFSSHQEVETFLHEFGHALHSLLSRTNFQHMSGTRAAMDFVETPSHWMENFAWDPEFLPHLAKLDKTGEPIPPEMIAALARSRNQFRFLEMQNQIVLATFDQAVFGAHMSTGISGAHNPMRLWEAIHRQYNVPFASGTHWFTNVGHLVTYGSGYYGYLYAQIFADAIWNQLFRSKGMKREAGVHLWKTLLQHGGAKDPNTILEELLGQKPTVETYWKSIHKT